MQHRRLWVNIPNADGGVTPTVASPLRLSDTPVEYRMPPPTLGQHTQEVLRTVLSKTSDEIERLSASGVI